MPTLFEEVSLGYKIANLAWQTGRVLANGAKSLFIKVPYRFIVSMTTLEFAYEGASQIAYFVQDRQVKIMRDDEKMPPYVFGTDGNDTVEGLLVNGTQYPSRIIERNGTAKTIGMEQEIVYSKNELLRCVLRIRAKNGFPTDNESFSMSVREFTDSATMLIIFDKTKPPKQVSVYYRKMKDKQGRWRAVSKDHNELREFTGGRKAFLLEVKNPPFGHAYKVEWTW